MGRTRQWLIRCALPTVAAGGVVLTCQCSGLAPHEIDAARLDQLRQATVLVQCPARQLREAGGLVVASSDETAYVATSRGILIRRGAVLSEARIVAHSGTEHELVREGRRIVDDADRDLAILAVEWPGHPEPVVLDRPIQFQESIRAVMLAFLEPAGRRAPRPCTVLPGQAYGAYEDSASSLAAFTFAARAEQWHSGGPVVDRSGRLLGLAAPLELGLRSSSVLPASRIASLLDGRVQTIQVWEQGVSSGEVRLGVEVRLFDPLARLDSVTLLLFQANQVSFDVPVGSDGRWPRLGPPAQSMPLELDNSRATGTVILESAEIDDREMVYQLEARVRGGGSWWSAPRALVARFSVGTSRP